LTPTQRQRNKNSEISAETIKNMKIIKIALFAVALGLLAVSVPLTRNALPSERGDALRLERERSLLELQASSPEAFRRYEAATDAVERASSGEMASLMSAFLSWLTAVLLIRVACSIAWGKRQEPSPLPTPAT
jgi:hypothetical protein